MANLLKSIKVNGTSYGIDYDSLANRPVYKDITMGEYLLEETDLEFTVPVDERTGDPTAPVAFAEIEIEPEFDSGDDFILMLDGEEYDCTAMTASFDGSTIYMVVASNNSSIGLQCVKLADGEWGDRIFAVPMDMEGAHTVSIQKCIKDIKIIDRELLGLYRLQTGPYAKLNKGLGTTDLIGGILAFEDGTLDLITRVSVLENSFIAAIYGSENCITYNPASGYLISTTSEDNTFDVTDSLSTSTNYESDDFIGSALVAGSGDPVLISGAAQSDTVWSLTALEQYLYDAEGIVVHDFSLGPVTLDTSTGEFTCNNGVVAEEIVNKVDSDSATLK